MKPTELIHKANTLRIEAEKQLIEVEYHIGRGIDGIESAAIKSKYLKEAVEKLHEFLNSNNDQI